MSAGSAAPTPISISTCTPRATFTMSASPSCTRSIDEIREIFQQVQKDIRPAVESRKLQLPIDKVFAFNDIGKAFERMEANQHLGKIVVRF
jgi:NADPH:quinone reductase-like Zn-dependent oxidoreductase